jgi:hypothetical protein
VYHNRIEEAHRVLAQTHSNGDVNSPIVLAQLKEIVDTIDYEKNVGETLSLKEIIKTPIARKRVLLAVSAAVFSTIAGLDASYLDDRDVITDVLLRKRGR